MGDLQQILLQQLGGGAVSKIAQQLGVDESTAQAGIQSALPVLLGALAKNTQTPEGAQALSTALETDHDGSVLSDVEGAIENHTSLGSAGIVGHLFGAQQENVAQAVGQHAGLDGGVLLQMLAPIVLGQLGQAQRQQGLDGNALAGLLGGATQQNAANPLVGMAMQFLDQNHDGSLVDDALKLAGQLFNRR